VTPFVWFGTGGRVRKSHARLWPAAGRWVVPGLAAIAVVVTLTVQAGMDMASHPPHWPFVRPATRSEVQRGVLGTGIVLAVAGLVAAWARLHRGAAESTLRWRPWGAAAAWALLFVLAPPLFSSDVYSYAAVGRLVELGQDPFVVGPAALGHGGFLAAVDPFWRETPTPYGPVLVALAHGAAVLAGGSVLLTVVVLRAVAIVSVVVAAVLAVRAADPAVRAGVLVLTVLNPLVLLHLVSSAHLDALVGGAAVAVVVLAMRRRWCLAMALAVTAFLVKAPGAVLIGFVLLHVLRAAEPRRRVRELGQVLVTGAGSLAACALLVPDPFGWVHALDVPGKAVNLAAPSAWLAALLDGLGELNLHTMSHRTVVALSRDLALVVGALLVLWLLWRGTGRSDRAGALRCVGAALLVVALSGPVLHPWYLAWGLFAVAAGGRRREQDGLVVLCGLATLLGLPGMPSMPVVLQVLVWSAVLVLWWWARPAALDQPDARLPGVLRSLPARLRA
jgi:alpha-1,6-mannosyltransferase